MGAPERLGIDSGARHQPLRRRNVEKRGRRTKSPASSGLPAAGTSAGGVTHACLVTGRRSRFAVSILLSVPMTADLPEGGAIAIACVGGVDHAALVARSAVGSAMSGAAGAESGADALARDRRVGVPVELAHERAAVVVAKLAATTWSGSRARSAGTTRSSGGSLRTARRAEPDGAADAVPVVRAGRWHVVVPRSVVKTHSLSRGRASSRSRSGSTIAIMRREPCLGGVILPALTFHWRSIGCVSAPGVKSRSVHMERVEFARPHRRVARGEQVRREAGRRELVGGGDQAGDLAGRRRLDVLAALGVLEPEPGERVVVDQHPGVRAARVVEHRAQRGDGAEVAAALEPFGDDELVDRAQRPVAVGVGERRVRSALCRFVDSAGRAHSGSVVHSGQHSPTVVPRSGELVQHVARVILGALGGALRRVVEGPPMTVCGATCLPVRGSRTRPRQRPDGSWLAIEGYLLRWSARAALARRSGGLAAIM